MKKILWLCNVEFSNIKIKRTASWLQPLFTQLKNTNNFELINITYGNVNFVTKRNFDGAEQWIIPINKKDKYNQIATIDTCKIVANLISNINPDLVHIWGTESIWASIYRQGYINQKSLLDIQGLLFVYEHFYYGGLTFNEILNSIHFKEILMPWRTLFTKKLIFKKRGLEEIKCIKTFNHIVYPSNWVKSQISYISNNSEFYYKPFMIREEFFNAQQWKFKKNNSPIIFTSCSAAVSYKGLHVLIKSVALLIQEFPDVQLRIAGQVNVGNKLLDGYSVFLNKLVKKLGLSNNVIFLGSLNANDLIKEIQDCNVVVVPSFIETYCLAFAEAMLIGAPVVVSYAGAMPELAIHEKEALFYNPNDIGMCASYIKQLINNQDYSEFISNNARSRRTIENNPKKTLDIQIDIYNTILNN